MLRSEDTGAAELAFGVERPPSMRSRVRRILWRLWGARIGYFDLRNSDLPGRRFKAAASTLECEAAWKFDPVSGVIGV